MKNVSAILKSLALIGICSLGLLAQPRLTVKEGTEFNLGEVKEGTIIEKQLTLVNTGNDTLVIEELRPTCGCTIAETKTKRLAPNKSTEMSFSINTQGFVGSLKKEISIVTNDSTKHELPIVLYLTVRNVIEFEPRFINLKTIPSDKPTKQSVTIRNNSDTLITITSVSSPDSQITVNLSSKKIPPKGTATLTATIKPKKKGPILGQFELLTDHPQKRVVNVSYIGKIK